MSLQRRVKITFIVYLLFAALPSVAAEDVPTGSYSKKESGFYLDHFDRVPDNSSHALKFRGQIFRGGQPDFNDGDEWLRKLKANKISLVIDLRSEAAGLSKEREALRAAGISYILLPWKTSGTDQPAQLKVQERVFVNGRLKEQSVLLDRVSASLRVLASVKKNLSQGRRIYFHCQRGEDRTGVFISLLRAEGEPWTNEFKRYGGSYYPSLKKHREDLVRALAEN